MNIIYKVVPLIFLLFTLNSYAFESLPCQSFILTIQNNTLNTLNLVSLKANSDVDVAFAPGSEILPGQTGIVTSKVTSQRDTITIDAVFTDGKNQLELIVINPDILRTSQPSMSFTGSGYEATSVNTIKYPNPSPNCVVLESQTISITQQSN